MLWKGLLNKSFCFLIAVVWNTISGNQYYDFIALFKKSEIKVTILMKKMSFLLYIYILKKEFWADWISKVEGIREESSKKDEAIG